MGEEESELLWVGKDIMPDLREGRILNFGENIYIPAQNFLKNTSTVYSSFRIIWGMQGECKGNWSLDL